jgi:MFS family permease
MRDVRPGAWLTLAVLFVVYTLNFLDRSLVYILFAPIRAELALSELQLALLGSTAFVLFYTVLGVPFGRLADRSRRTALIAAGLAVWSVASSCTGLATSFAGLLLCRVLVGVGEATLGPAAYSLLADWFPPHRRATAAALFSAGIPLGAGLATGLGGVLADRVGWRAVFPLLGLPGLLVAGVVLLLPEPTRGGSEARADVDAGSLGAMLRGSMTPWLHVTGYATLAIASNAWGMWVPSWLAARFDRSLAEVGLAVGACTVVGGLLGTGLGGTVADALQRRFRGGRMLFGAALALGSAAVWTVLIGTSSWPVALLCCGAGLMLGLAWLGPASADVQDLVPAAHRGLAISGYYLVVNVVGYGLGAPVIGALADRMGGAADPARMAQVLAVCPIACCVAAAILLAGAIGRSASHPARTASAGPQQAELASASAPTRRRADAT